MLLYVWSRATYVAKYVCCLIVALVALLLPIARMPVKAASTHTARPIYFSVWDSKGRELLRVRKPNGLVSSIFPHDDDGAFDTLSPDGSTITFERWDWLSPEAELPTLWLGDLRHGSQMMIASAPNKESTIGASWSPDGQYLLVGGLYAVAPLWAGYNYGYRYIYKVADHTIITLPDLLGFVEGWYPDSQHLLVWQQDVGYFKYSIFEATVSNLPLPNLGRDVKEHSYPDTLSRTLPYLAVQTDFPVVIHIYDANTGLQLRQLTFPMSNFGYDPTGAMAWSPDEQYLAYEVLHGDDDDLVVLSRETYERIASVPIPSGYSFVDVNWFWSSDSRDLVVLAENRGGDTSLYLADIPSGEMTKVYDEETF